MRRERSGLSRFSRLPFPLCRGRFATLNRDSAIALKVMGKNRNKERERIQAFDRLAKLAGKQERPYIGWTTLCSDRPPPLRSLLLRSRFSLLDEPSDMPALPPPLPFNIYTP